MSESQLELALRLGEVSAHQRCLTSSPARCAPSVSQGWTSTSMASAGSTFQASIAQV
jgi:hypothetical protein